MTTSAEASVPTAIGSAAAANRARHGAPARRLLRLLSVKRDILLTTHLHPDPDALASGLALGRLLQSRLPESRITLSVKGDIGGGYNIGFLQQTELALAPWDEQALGRFDAIVLLDVQPLFKLSPLPAGIAPFAVIDHHPSRGRRPACAFCDIRTDVGATSSIVFSYFMELGMEIPPDVAAALLFGIESDLAGAAGQPGDLDNIALSSLTLLADPRRLYKMRYAPLPRSIYEGFWEGLSNAVYYDSALITHLDEIHSAEVPAVIADFLVRFDQVQWVLVTALSGSSLVLSLRNERTKLSAADIMRRLVRGIGEGGGHRAKAGGLIALENTSPACVEHIRKRLCQRLLRALKIPSSRGQRLIAAAYRSK